MWTDIMMRMLGWELHNTSHTGTVCVVAMVTAVVLCHSPPYYHGYSSRPTSVCLVTMATAETLSQPVSLPW